MEIHFLLHSKISQYRYIKYQNGILKTHLTTFVVMAFCAAEMCYSQTMSHFKAYPLPTPTWLQNKPLDFGILWECVTPAQVYSAWLDMPHTCTTSAMLRQSSAWQAKLSFVLKQCISTALFCRQHFKVLFPWHSENTPSPHYIIDKNKPKMTRNDMKTEKCISA